MRKTWTTDARLFLGEILLRIFHTNFPGPMVDRSYLSTLHIALRPHRTSLCTPHWTLKSTAKKAFLEKIMYYWPRKIPLPKSSEIFPPRKTWGKSTTGRWSKKICIKNPQTYFSKKNLPLVQENSYQKSSEILLPEKKIYITLVHENWHQTSSVTQ